jgi:hypothetical protein
MIQFAIFYGCQSSPSLYDWRLVGEQWTSASAIQAAGFVLMTWGLLMYNAAPKYPCWDYGDGMESLLSNTPLVIQDDREEE